MKEIDLQSLVRPHVKVLRPYASARDDYNGFGTVFLDANENPFQTAYNRYPDPHQRVLKESVSRLKNVHANQIFLGNGSDEAIDLLIRLFCEPGKDHVVVPQPTYGMFSVCAEIHDVKVISPRLNKYFDLESEVILNALTTETKMIFLCSPNNPSGNLLNAEEIEKMISTFKGIVVIDEAYIDFTTKPSWITKLDQFKNLAVLQTFSKAWGLAGLRLGMCFANQEIITLLDRIKLPYNVNASTQANVLNSINDRKEEKDKQVQLIVAEREALRNNLIRLPRVAKVHPSDANFLLVEFDNAKMIYEQLLTDGIVVRDRSTVVLCDNCLRITVGTPEENRQLIQAIQEL